MNFTIPAGGTTTFQLRIAFSYGPVLNCYTGCAGYSCKAGVGNLRLASTACP